jgi:predicted transcriptional regulator
MSKTSDSYDELRGRGRNSLHFDSRSTNSIVASVLTLSKNGVKKSDLAQKAGLSYSILERYLRFLVEQGLLEENVSFDTFEGRSSTILYATKKGIDFLEKYNWLLGIAEERFASEPVGKYDDNPFRTSESELRF